MIYRPGDPEPCRVHATQQATETNPILQNLQKLITNPSAAISEEPETKVSKESQLVEKKSDIQPDVVKVTITNPSTSPTPKPHENGNIGMFESSFLTNMMQEIAAPLIGNTGEDDGVDQTEAVADSTNRADDSDNASQEKLMADTSDKDDDSGNVGQEKIAAGTADKADDSDNVGKANLMADKTDKADDSGNAGQENFSPPDTSDGNMETNNDHILDILKKGKQLKTNRKITDHATACLVYGSLSLSLSLSAVKSTLLFLYM